MFYSHNQLLLLSGEPSFETPEKGMIEIYGGRNRVQITGEGEEFFRDLHYVGRRCPVDDRDRYHVLPNFFHRDLFSA